MLTIRPRICAGDTSAIYMGESMDAMPTPMPAANLAEIKNERLCANDMARDEKRNMRPDNNKAGFRPYFSETLPARMHPAMHPKANEPVVNPSQYAFRPNCDFKNGSAPEITAKSNPNRYPPKAEIRDINKIYPVL